MKPRGTSYKQSYCNRSIESTGSIREPTIVRRFCKSQWVGRVEASRFCGGVCLLQLPLHWSYAAGRSGPRL